MEEETLYAEYEQARAANDVPKLRRIARSVPDSAGRAAEILNCTGHSLGLLAESYVDLAEAIDLVERATLLATDDLLRAKAFVSLAAFCTWGNSLTRATVAAGKALQIDVAETDAWLHGSAAYNMAHALYKMGNFEQAQEFFEATLGYPTPLDMIDRTRVALATLAARKGDAKVVDELLGRVEHVALVPHMTGARARLALVLGDYREAKALVLVALGAFKTQRHPFVWSELFELWALYGEVLQAQGETEEASRIQQLIAGMNGGFGYRT